MSSLVSLFRGLILSKDHHASQEPRSAVVQPALDSGQWSKDPMAVEGPIHAGHVPRLNPMGALGQPMSLKRSAPSESPAALSAKVIEEFFNAVTENTGSLTKERYVCFHACMFRALRTEFNEQEALQRAALDFCADAKGGMSVKKERFCNMIRTLSERWTSEPQGQTNPDLAAQFVRKLFLSITFMETRLGPDVRRLLPYSAVPLGSCIPPQRRRPQTVRAQTFPPQTSRPGSPSDDDQSSDSESGSQRRASTRPRRLSDSMLPAISTGMGSSSSMPELRRSSSPRKTEEAAKPAALPQLAVDSASLRRFAVLNSARVRARSDRADEGAIVVHKSGLQSPPTSARSSSRQESY